jgi:acetylornithine deacetylase
MQPESSYNFSQAQEVTVVEQHIIDEGAAIGTLRAAIGYPSITGAEANFAAYLAELLSHVGMQKVIVRDFLPGRPNVVGIKRGVGNGKCLMLIGYTDVVHVRGWHERWAGDAREDPFGAAVVGRPRR